MGGRLLAATNGSLRDGLDLEASGDVFITFISPSPGGGMAAFPQTAVPAHAAACGGEAGASLIPFSSLVALVRRRCANRGHSVEGCPVHFCAMCLSFGSTAGPSLASKEDRRWSASNSLAADDRR
jgi:hypothetical protein